MESLDVRLTKTAFYMWTCIQVFSINIVRLASIYCECTYC